MRACLAENTPLTLQFGLTVLDAMLDKRDDMIRMKHNNMEQGRGNRNSFRPLPRSSQTSSSQTSSSGEASHGSSSSSSSKLNEPSFVPLSKECLIPAIELCHRVGENTRAVQFDREFQFNYPSQYEDYITNKNGGMYDDLWRPHRK
jgi:hypothetical protein